MRHPLDGGYIGDHRVTSEALATSQGQSTHPEPHYGFEPPGVWAYTNRSSVEAGGSLSLYVSAPAAYSLTIERLGLDAIIDPASDENDERRDTELVHARESPAGTPQLLCPGSYIFVTGAPIPCRSVSMGCWLRLWRAPCIDTLQWAWSGIVGDFDYPDHCRIALLVTQEGKPAAYVGDGGPFRSDWLHVAEVDLRNEYGRWHHLVLCVDDDFFNLYLDGERISTRVGIPPERRLVGRERLRIGATAENGCAADFLDGDIAMPFVSSVALDASWIGPLAKDRGLHDLCELGVPAVEGCWPLDEETGVTVEDRSGRGRHGVLVNGGTWQIGGPASDAALGVPGYTPDRDPTRGHGLRLSSDDLLDCGWDPAMKFTIADDAPSGIYAATVRLTGQDPSRALAVPFVVVRTRPVHAGSIALLCATNTWHAYGRIPRDEILIPGLTSSFYTRHRSGRPYFRLGLSLPIPRADPFGYESARAARARHSHLVRPERFAQAWLTQSGYPFECISDAELDADPTLLSRFLVLVICGHSEYWTSSMRDAVQSFLSGGGKVLSMSGNTLYWRVSTDHARTALEARKVSAAGGEWLPPIEWGERWHSDDGRAGGTWSILGHPAHEVLGLDMQGMIDDGSPACFAPFQVVDPEHFLMTSPERVPLSKRGTIGERCLNGPMASGYEMDATPPVVGTGPLPPGMEVLASAFGQHLIEAAGDSADHGADIVYWRRPNGGEVVNLGSIAISGALSVDPGIGSLVRNALWHFGVRALPAHMS